MKSFFNSKLNIAILSFVGIAILCLIISLLVPAVVIGCLISTAVICFLLAAVFIRRYRKIKELKKEGNIAGEEFDASEYGYEEEVYLIPDDNKKVLKRKINLSMDGITPAILFIAMGVIMLGMLFSVIFKIV